MTLPLMPIHLGPLLFGWDASSWPLALAYAPEESPIDQIASDLGANGLPYALPIHPNLVHLTIGLFVIAIAFDLVGALYPLEKRVFLHRSSALRLSSQDIPTPYNGTLENLTIIQPHQIVEAAKALKAGQV